VHSLRKTNREIEIKLRLADAAELVRKLALLRAKCKGRVFERNDLFDTPEADFRRRGWLLRLRTEVPAPSGRLPGGRASALLTLKTPAYEPPFFQYKQKLEREARITDPVRFGKALGKIGLGPSFRYEKYRSSFTLPGLPSLDISLDETPAGTFLEVEGRPEAIDRAARLLGFSKRDYLRSTYWDVYAADCRRRGSRPRNMVFRA
jgi:adenylate cyclase, class 2